eukprot:3941578-Rhodomonas_salina.1
MSGPCLRSIEARCRSAARRCGAQDSLTRCVKLCCAKLRPGCCSASSCLRPGRPEENTWGVTWHVTRDVTWGVTWGAMWGVTWMPRGLSRGV